MSSPAPSPSDTLLTARPGLPAARPHPLSDPKAPGARDLVTRWLAGFLEVGSLVKRLDTGEGSYAIELEEDVGVYDALGQARSGRGRGPVVRADA